MHSDNNITFLSTIADSEPDAYCYITGTHGFPNLKANMYFYKTDLGVLISLSATNLPALDNCGIFGFHLHEGTKCELNPKNPSLDYVTVGNHYNPTNTFHPCHTGDLPPIFSANGNAIMTYLLTQFTINEVVGRAVIIHAMPDDFTSHPDGHSGAKIACGIIEQ